MWPSSRQEFVGPLAAVVPVNDIDDAIIGDWIESSLQGGIQDSGLDIKGVIECKNHMTNVITF